MEEDDDGRRRRRSTVPNDLAEGTGTAIVRGRTLRPIAYNRRRRPAAYGKLGVIVEARQPCQLELREQDCPSQKHPREGRACRGAPAASKLQTPN